MDPDPRSSTLVLLYCGCYFAIIKIVRHQTGEIKMQTKAQQVAELRTKLMASERWQVRAVLALYKRQTEAERFMRETVEHNKIGFNAIDAEILSSFAEQLQAGRTMSAKQMDIIRRKIGKYSRQLWEIAQEKQEQERIQSAIQADADSASLEELEAAAAIWDRLQQ
jgi:ATP-dependent Lon protease